MSDSEESTGSTACTGNTNENGIGGTCKLSLVADFDDLMRMIRQQRDDAAEDVFLDFVEKSYEFYNYWKTAVQECQRLQVEVDKSKQEYSDLEGKLIIARKLLDQEKKKNREGEREREELESQINKVCDILLKDTRIKMPDETKEKLGFLNFNAYHRCRESPNLSMIKEANTTGSLLSNFSYSYSEDDLDGVTLKSGKGWKVNHANIDEAPLEPAPKRRRSSNNKVIEISNTEKVKATTTLTVSKLGPITATSVIESVPFEEDGTPNYRNTVQPTAPPINLINDIWQGSSTATDINIGLKQHNFNTKTLVISDLCTVCEKRIGFGKTLLKCKLCRSSCHPECKDLLPLPCIPSVNTPTQRNASGTIRDYTPTTLPMVPAIIVHCLREIESRGLNELGIYRIPGSERDVKSLKEKFLRGKGVPMLNQVDIHVICGTVKDFLRSLSETLVTYKLWGEFVKAVAAKDEQDVQRMLHEVISKLPQPNRDTLAYMILHLKKVAEAKDCKMPVDNLAKIFGPTIVGYSSSNPRRSVIMSETKQVVEVMQHLINLPAEYWSGFIKVDSKKTRLQQTPSTDSLLKPSAKRNIFSPHACTIRKPLKWATPPTLKKIDIN